MRLKERMRFDRKQKFVLAVFVALTVITGIYFYYQSYASGGTVLVGAYTPNYGDMATLEGKLGQKFDAFLWYNAITQSFDTNFGQNLKNDGRVLQLAWEPRDPVANAVNQPKYSLKQISGGAHDVAIRRWARQLKAYGGVVYFRPMSEMNGNWASWCGTVNGNVPADYAPAWRRVRNIFREEQATNVKFVWTVNAEDFPRESRNTIDKYYPGDNYVDYIGINGYNSSSTWRGFGSVFEGQYRKVATINTRKPMIIGETATGEGTTPQQKAGWIFQIPSDITRYFPRVKQLYWFSAKKEQDWRVDSSQASIDTFKAMMMSSPFN